MNLEELKIKLSQEDLIKDKFHIGQAFDNRFCIVCENNVWSTFHYERGRRTILKTYTNESDACTAFYERMMKAKERILR